MSLADSDSRLHGDRSPSTGGNPGTPRSRDTIWLNGDVLSCACPECGSPMSIRLWLMLADCWRCGTSIELTLEQEQVARRLLEEQKQRTAAASKAPPAPAPAPAPAPTAPAVAATKPAEIPILPAPRAPAPEKPAAPSAPPARQPAPPSRRPASQRPSRMQQRLAAISEHGEAHVWFRDALSTLPAWLVSLLVHMVVLIVLGLLLIPRKTSPPAREYIVLSVVVGDEGKSGEDIKIRVEPPTKLPIDEPRPADPTPEPALAPSFPTPRPDLRPDVMLDRPSKPDVPVVTAGPVPGGPVLPAGMGSAGNPSAILAGRNPDVRAAVARREGGTSESEAAVARGLKWLERHQHVDGRWGLHDFSTAGDCRGQCRDPGLVADTSATALALLAYLGAGNTHQRGEYRATVDKGLRWLIEAQGPDGDLRGRGSGRMYAHGQATIALCEALALSQDSKLRGPAQRAVDFVLAAQHRRGGWRYRPNEPGDTSVVGWQLMALRSARMADLDVPEEAFTRAATFLDSVQTEHSVGLFGYTPGSRETETMTAEGLLSRQYSGWRPSNPMLAGGVEWLLKKHLPNQSDSNMYYWYYATQVMHHFGGQPWDTWNPKMRDLLIATQERLGHEAGSWTPRENHDSSGGRVYMTALAVCTLEVYYRHLPLYQLEAADSEHVPNKPSPKRSR